MPIEVLKRSTLVVDILSVEIVRLKSQTEHVYLMTTQPSLDGGGRLAMMFTALKGKGEDWSRRMFPEAEIHVYDYGRGKQHIFSGPKAAMLIASDSATPDGLFLPSAS